MVKTIVSLFPGLDLLGRAFETFGFCVLRGPDKIIAGDIRNFHLPRDLANGIIGGSPCQDFSAARRSVPPTGYGKEMILQFARCVTEAQSNWWLLENVPNVPHLRINGYTTKRYDICDSDHGGLSRRLRHIQFGHRPGEPFPIILADQKPTGNSLAPTATAREGQRGSDRRRFKEFCALQGIKSEEFKLKDFTKRARYKLVGNGVAWNTGIAIAAAVMKMYEGDNTWFSHATCGCGCGRPIQTTGGRKYAGSACRKRAQRDRAGQKEIIVYPSELN